MDQTNEPLAAFLAEPDRAAAEYIDWLELRGDPRGEYLRLLTTLDEPGETDTDGHDRLRLRALREQVDDAWAAAVDVTRLRWDGVYQTTSRTSTMDLTPHGRPGVSVPVGPYRMILRFYPDGLILRTSSDSTAAQVWRWFHREADGLPYHGRWTLRADRLSFYIMPMRLMDPNVFHKRWSGDDVGWRELVEAHNAECMAKRKDSVGVLGSRTLVVTSRNPSIGKAGVEIYTFERVG